MKEYKVVLSGNWGKNSGIEVVWDWSTLNSCLEAEKKDGKGHWIKSYQKIKKDVCQKQKEND